MTSLAVFPPEPESVPAARHFVVDQLREDGCRSVGVETEIAVTELASNAVRHAGTAFTVQIEKQGDSAVIEVVDGSADLPRMREPDDEGGRGLRLVEAVAIEWGVREAPPGKAVYVRLPC